ncbi:MAG: hypothetical protein PHH82_04435 [Candidatus ainarchaeum sp.]|nr:hypothetical protein [Candidatus ainarchaeum sp.]
MKVPIHKILSFILLFFAFFLIFSLTYADGFIPKVPHKVPQYIPQRDIPIQRYLPDAMPLPASSPKEFNFSFVPDGQYLFYSGNWSSLSQEEHGIKLSYTSKDSKKAYMEYNPKGSFTLEDLKFDSLSLIYAVKLEEDALVLEGTQVSFKVNDSQYNNYAFLGKTSSANVEITLSTDHDYLSPFLRSLKVTLYPIKEVSIDPVIIQTNESSILVDLKNYIDYYDFALGKLTYKLLENPANCNISGSVLTCNQISEGTKYYTLEVKDIVTNQYEQAPIEITKNSSSPYFTDLPTINVQEDTQIGSINLLPYVQDPNNTTNELSLSVDYIAPASGISCEVDNFTLNCSLVKDAYGAFVVMIKAEDPQGNTAFGDLKVNVSNVNDAPSWNSIPINNLEEGQTLNLNLANFVSDVDNPSSTLYFEIKDNGGLNCGLVGPNLSCSTTIYPISTTLSVSASDGQYEVDKEISVSWSKDNLAPVFSGKIIGKTSTGSNLSFSKDLLGMFSDSEGQELSYNYLVLNGPAICNIENKVLYCNITSQGYSDVKVTASDGDKTVESNIFRLAKVSPADVTATVDVPHTVPLDYEVYFQVYVTNNLSIYLEGIEVTASSTELVIFDGQPEGHTTITELIPKIEPNSTKESEFHTTVENTEKIYNIMLMLNGQQLDSKQIETKDIFYAAGNGLVSMWQDMGDNDGAGFWGVTLYGKVPKDNKLKIKVHITNLYDVPLNDLNLCYVSQNGLLKPMSNGQVLYQNVYCQLVDVPALDELVLEQEIMPTEFGADGEYFLLSKGKAYLSWMNTDESKVIAGYETGASFEAVDVSKGLSAVFNPADGTALNKNKTYSLQVSMLNYFAVPLYNQQVCMIISELVGADFIAYTETSYAKVNSPTCKTYNYVPYAIGSNSNQIGQSTANAFSVQTKGQNASVVFGLIDEPMTGNINNKDDLGYAIYTVN